MKDFSKNKFATTIVIIATLLLAGVAVFSAIRLYNLRSESVTPTTPESEPSASEDESGWPQCNGWDPSKSNFNPNYDKIPCRVKALERADNGIADKDKMSGDFYDHGLPLPPSGDKNSPNGGTDQQWYNWGMTETSPVDFLSHGTSCGLGPNACVSGTTNTPTLTPTGNPSNTPIVTPSGDPTRRVTPSGDPTRRVTPSGDPTRRVTITPTKALPKACTPLSFSLASPELACLGDQVIYDTNKNGIQDTNEEGVSGIPVELYDNGDSLIDESTTSAQGIYKFCNLKPGTYYVMFDIDDTYTTSVRGQGSDRCKDSDANTTTGMTGEVTLVAGDNYKCLDALIYKEGVSSPTSSPTAYPTATSTPDDTVTPTEKPTTTWTPDGDVEDDSVTYTTGAAEGDSADLPEAGVGTPTMILLTIGFVFAIFAIAIAI